MIEVLFEKKVCFKIKVADRFWTRLRGLLGTNSLNNEHGLLIVPCNSVHMLGMKYAIDVIYFDRQNKIIKIVENLKPCWGCSICFKANKVLEVNAGMAKKYNLTVGQKMKIVNR